MKVGQEITLLSRIGLVGPGELRIHLRVQFSNSDNAAVNIRKGSQN